MLAGIRARSAPGFGLRDGPLPANAAAVQRHVPGTRPAPRGRESRCSVDPAGARGRSRAERARPCERAL